MRDLNPRQLRAIDEYLKTGVKSRAYALAGYRYANRETLDAAAAQLFRNIKVKREVDRRKRQMLKRSDITIEKLLNDTEEARKLAVAAVQPSAATGAIALQAKLVGLLIDRKESGAPGDFQGLTSPADVIAAIRNEMGDAAADALLAVLGQPKALPPAPEPAEPAPAPTATGTGTVN